MADKKIALELEVNIKKGDMTLGELNSQLNEIKSSLQEQQTALIEYQKELAKLEEQRNAILSKGTISSEEFNIQESLNAQIKTVNASINTQKLSIKSLTAEQSNAATAVKSLTAESVNYSKITAAVDKLTGGLATKTTKLYKGFGEGAKAVKGFNASLGNMTKALVATGIGALVVALGLVVAYWDDIKGLIDGVSGEQKKLLGDTEKTLKTNEENLAATEASENSLKLQGKSEQEILDLKIKQTDEVIAATELLLEQQKEIEKSQNAAAERNQKIVQGIIGFISAPITILLGAVDALTDGLARLGAIDKGTDLLRGYTKGTAKLLGFDPEEVKKEGEATTKETEKQLLALKNKRDGYVIKGREDAKKANDKATEDRKKADEKAANELEKKNKEEERLEKEKQKALEDIRQGLIDTEAERRQEELDAVDRQYKELIELAKKYGGDVDDLAKAQQAKKDEITKKNADADAAAEKAKQEKTLKEQEDLIKSLEYKQEQDANDFELRRAELARREEIFKADTTLTNEQKLLLEKQFSEELKRIDEEQNANRRQLASQRLEIASDILGSINRLTQAFAKDDEASQRKAFKLNKAAGIGQAIISTAVGINNAFVNPADVASGIAFAKAAAIGASGITQIATISKTQFQGGTQAVTPPPTLGSGGAGASPIGFTQTLNNTQIPTTKVIVTETDIRRATRNIDGIYNKAVVVE
jgi:hypothetical protein